MNYLIHIDPDYFRLVYRDFDQLPEYEKVRLAMAHYEEIKNQLNKRETIVDYTGYIKITPLAKHRLRIVRSLPAAFKY